VVTRNAGGFALLLALIACALSVPADAATDKAMWVWEADAQSLLLDDEAATAVIDFAHQQGLSTLYVYADRYEGRNLLVDDPDRWRRLLDRLHAAGFRVEALLGSAFLHTERYVLPESRPEMLDMFRHVLEFNAASTTRESRFDAIHFDIEPYQLPQWDEDPDALLIDYLDLGRAVIELRRASGQDLPIGPDIPFWLDTLVLEWEGHTRSVAEHVIRLFDFVTLMDYRNFAKGSDGIIAHAAVELDIAARSGRKVVIGVETGDGELPKVSFGNRRPADLEQALAQTEAAFHDNAAFAGFAIHHYTAWKAWLRKSTP
jgi:hypothetical protein